MFGILFFLFIGICGFIANAKKSYYDFVMFSDQIENDGLEYGTYSTGEKRIDIKTGQRCTIRKPNLYGQTVVINEKGKALRNISEEMNREIYEKSKRLSHIYLTACKQELAVDKYSIKAEGNRYLDLESEKLMVVRKFKTAEGNCSFFMDLENGLLLRPTDWQRRYWDGKEKAYYVNCFEEERKSRTKKEKLAAVNFADEFNHKQLMDKANSGLVSKKDFFSHYYFNDCVSSDPFLDEAYKRLDPKFDENQMAWAHGPNDYKVR